MLQPNSPHRATDAAEPRHVPVENSPSRSRDRRDNAAPSLPGVTHARSQLRRTPDGPRRQEDRTAASPACRERRHPPGLPGSAAVGRPGTQPGGRHGLPGLSDRARSMRRSSLIPIALRFYRPRLLPWATCGTEASEVRLRAQRRHADSRSSIKGAVVGDGSSDRVSSDPGPA
jgi:hypothetical protein